MAYTPFKTMEKKLAGKPGVTDPAGLAAYIAARKYGQGALQQHAKSHTSMRDVPPLKKHKKGKHHAALARFVKQHHKGA